MMSQIKEVQEEVEATGKKIEAIPVVKPRNTPSVVQIRDSKETIETSPFDKYQQD